MAHVGILFCLYDHLKQLKEENIMAYMSEEGYKKLMAELKELETVERPKISAAIAEAEIKETCLKTLNTMQQKKRKVCSKCVSTN
jgi:transcription elongation factor GreA